MDDHDAEGGVGAAGIGRAHIVEAVRARRDAGRLSGGTVASAVDPSVEETAREHGVRGVYFVVEPSRVRLAGLTRRIDAGELRPSPGKTVLSVSALPVGTAA